MTLHLDDRDAITVLQELIHSFATAVSAAQPEPGSQLEATAMRNIAGCQLAISALEQRIAMDQANTGVKH